MARRPSRKNRITWTVIPASSLKPAPMILKHSARNPGTALRKVSSPARIPMEKKPTAREMWIISTAARAFARTIFQDSTGRVNIRYPSSFKSPL